MDEAPIIAAILNSRAAHDALAGKLHTDDFSEYGRKIITEAVAYYKRDTAATSIDRTLLSSALERAFPNPKQARAIIEYLDELPDEVSEENVVALYRELRRYNVGLDLADRLGRGLNDAATDALIEKYHKLATEDELDSEGLLPELGEAGEIVPVTPRNVRAALDGGIERGSSVILFGRPHCGKTLLATAFTDYWARQCKERVLYLTNEDGPRAIYRRVLARGTRTPVREIKRNAEVRDQAVQRGAAIYGENLVIKQVSGGMREVEGLVNKYQPQMVIVDQLRNLKANGNGGNFSLSLDELARGVKDLALSRQLIVVSLVQAGDSAEGKLVLDMGDVDWSNTGIPGAADILIGLGVNDRYMASNKRRVTFCKNRENGNLGSLDIWIEPQLMWAGHRPLTRDERARYLGEANDEIEA